jgi:spermidine synthase
MKTPTFPELPSRIEDPLSFFESRFAVENPWHLATSEFERRKYSRQISAVSAFARPKRILELGAAEGAFTRMLLDSFPEATVHAVEISPSATLRAKERLRDKGERSTIHQADIKSFLRRSDPRHWDTIFWSECMHYVARSCTMLEFLELLRICVRSVTAGGLLCSVNTIKSPDSEDNSSYPSFVRATQRLFRDYAECCMWCHYVDYKTEDHCRWEYELCLYQVP